MKYQKIANLLNDTSNKSSKFRTRNWVEINDDIRDAYSPNKQIRFKVVMLVYEIAVMLICLLKEIYQFIILLVLVLLQITQIKK